MIPINLFGLSSSGGLLKSKYSEKQCGIGMNANVGGPSADAGISTSGVYAEAKLGK
jgi:hypothetical protein